MALFAAMLEISSAQFTGPYIRNNLSLTVIVKYPEQHLTVGNNNYYTLLGNNKNSLLTTSAIYVKYDVSPEEHMTSGNNKNSLPTR